MHFFQNYANYALRAELCDFTSAHNSGSPEEDNEADVSVLHKADIFQALCLDKGLTLKLSASLSPYGRNFSPINLIATLFSHLTCRLSPLKELYVSELTFGQVTTNLNKENPNMEHL